MRQDWDEKLAQKLTINIDVVGLLAVVFDGTEVDLQVADHVPDNEANADNPGDRHDVLLANGSRVEVEEERFTR